MIAMKLLLMVAGVLLLARAVEIPLYGLWMRMQNARRKSGGEESLNSETRNEEPAVEARPVNWRQPVALAVAGCVPLLMATGLVVVPSGMGGVVISQMRGTLPGTLYPGVHFITPMVDTVQTFDLRDHFFTAGVLEDGAKSAAEK